MRTAWQTNQARRVHESRYNCLLCICHLAVFLVWVYTDMLTTTGVLIWITVILHTPCHVGIKIWHQFTMLVCHWNKQDSFTFLIFPLWNLKVLTWLFMGLYVAIHAWIKFWLWCFFVVANCIIVLVCACGYVVVIHLPMNVEASIDLIIQPVRIMLLFPLLWWLSWPLIV